MKIKFFLVLCWLLLSIKCDTEIKGCEDVDDPQSKSECLKWPETSAGFHCCYVRLNFKEIRNDGIKELSYCYSIPKEDFENLDNYSKDYIRKYEEVDGELEDYDFICSSSSFVFLKIGLVSLIVALLI